MSSPPIEVIAPLHRKSAVSIAVSLILGGVLLTAAMLKVHGDAFTLDDQRTAFFTSRPVVLAEAAFEVLLGSALIAGVWPGVIRRLAMAFFTIVFFVAAGEAIRGKSSCGCFGQLVVPPWVTALGDAAAVAALWLFPMRMAARSSILQLSIGGGLILMSFAAAIGIEVYRPHFIAVGRIDGDVPGQSLGTPGAFVELRCSQWIGNRFPIGAHIPVLGAQLMRGRWIVLLVHHDCRHCLAAIDAFEAESINAASKPGAPPLAVIEMPPYGDPEEKVVHPPTVLGTLDESRNWFAPTPVALLLQDGIVKAEQEQSSAGEPDSKWWESR